jgi:L-lactate utilization protein LutB
MLHTLKKNLEALGYTVSVFETKEAAADYLDAQINGKTVGMGGSVTLRELDLYARLQSHNTVFWHLALEKGASVMQTRKDACRAEIYLTSVNAISEAGEIVNIDNTGNRVAAAAFGCEKVYFVLGENKLSPTLEDAVYRARNVAAPLNARRLGLATPCAVKADRCHDCDSPYRICRNLSIFLKKPTGCDYEIILIREALGY